MLSNKSRIDAIEELEDYLLFKIKSFSEAQRSNKLNNIMLSLLLQFPSALEEKEKILLIKMKSSGFSKVTDDETREIRLLLSSKLKDSIQSEQKLSDQSPSHWVSRLIYVLISEEPHQISDQIELIFNAVDFCDLCLDKVRKIIEQACAEVDVTS